MAQVRNLRSIARHKEIAAVFHAVAVAEKQHEKRYLGLLTNVEAGTVSGAQV